MADVELVYYTDPAFPWSWAAEPALSRLDEEFATGVAITYVRRGHDVDVPGEPGAQSDRRPSRPRRARWLGGELWSRA